MVVKKNATQSFIQTSPAIATQKNYLKTSFHSAFTITPFDLEGTSFNYFPPILLLSFVATFCSLITVFLILSPSSLTDYISISLISYFVIFIYSLIATFLYSYFGCLILGHDQGPKHFGVVASSFVVFPLVVLICSFNIGMLNYMAMLGCSMLMPYYINSTYQRYYPMGTDRTRFIYSVFGFLGFYGITAGMVGLCTAGVAAK